MRLHIVLALTAALGAVNAFGIGGASSSAAAQQPQTQWDGVYTTEQAKRGEAVYGAACATCHGPELTGGGMAPELVGGQFLADWSGLSIGELFERIRVSMPADNPGSLSRQQDADILAFIFFKGQFPAGSTELSTRDELLSLIKFEATKPGN